MNENYNDEELTYTVNGKSVDKETFIEYVSKFAPNVVNNENKDIN